MFVEDARGIKRTAYPVRDDGPQYCSDCGRHLIVGMCYTRFTPYHPITGRPGLMGIRCEACLPFRVIDRSPEDFDTPVRVSTPPVRNTEGIQRDDSWLNSLPRREWKRETPTHIDQVLTTILPAAQRSQRTDPKLWKILKEVLSK